MLLTGAEGSRSHPKGKKPRTFDDQAEEEVTRARKSTNRSALRTKRAANKLPPLSKMADRVFVERRSANPYVIAWVDLDPTLRGSNPYFYNTFQEKIFNEILMRKKKDNFVDQH
ncbi:hypothetical protein JBE27_56795, partial [Streptomyces albiflaviniger]|nr:hypothetical protein [Streptomyces albiflaviniger]